MADGFSISELVSLASSFARAALRAAPRGLITRGIKAAKLLRYPYSSFDFESVQFCYAPCRTLKLTQLTL